MTVDQFRVLPDDLTHTVTDWDYRQKLDRLMAEHFAACVAVESIRGTVLTTTTNWEMAFSDAVMKRNAAYRAVLDHIAIKPQEGGGDDTFHL